MFEVSSRIRPRKVSPSNVCMIAISTKISACQQDALEMEFIEMQAHQAEVQICWIHVYLSRSDQR
jgi:hypothetical protein